MLESSDDPEVVRDLQRSVEAVREQLRIGRRLATARAALQARIESGGLGLQQLAAQVSEMTALASPGTSWQHGGPDRRAHRQLEALREGLSDAASLSDRALAMDTKEDGMIRLFRRTYRYTVALLTRRFEDAADPEIQIEQAIEEGKRQHGLLVQQAAAVIGNQHELELRLGRSIDRVGRPPRVGPRGAAARRRRRRTPATSGQAASYESTAESFAVALVTSEAELRDLKVLHDHAVHGAAAAKEAVETNALELRRRLTERTRLLSQLEQTKMQERMNAALGSLGELAPDSDVPTLERVRDKLERRYAQALGMAEVQATTVEVGALQVQKASLDAQAARALSEIRLSLQEGEVTPTS